MTIEAAPLVSLQTPKDVSIEEIETELREIWESYNNSEEGLLATRASTFTFVVYEPDGTQQYLAALGFYSGPLDGIAGARTDAAIKAAQKAYNLEETGHSDPALLARLEEEFNQLTVLDKQTPENLRTALQYSPDSNGVGLADAIASTNPCRIITLCPTVAKDTGVKVQVSAYCPIQKRGESTLVCCEYITLRGTAEALERVGGLIAELILPELPKYIWWKATPQPSYSLFKRLIEHCDSLVVDSSGFTHPEQDLMSIANLIQEGRPIIDLNWRRIAPWQELAAEAFDPPERRAAIWEIDQIEIDYEKGNQSQAFMYLGWLASRLKWTPVSYQYEGGDYDIRRIKFKGKEQQEIEAELAGIPTADWGDIPGDLISLKLASTNPEADCGTVLCSETIGCMRMEAGGGAQTFRIQQVTSLADQKTENLLAQQLQRRGRDLLYQESMLVLQQMLNISYN